MTTAGVPDIASNWEDLSGQKDWKDLLDPIDINLRYALINYGERAASTQLALYNKLTDGCRGFSRFSELDFFNRLGVDKNKVIPYKYEVKKFIYARVNLSILGDEFLEESTWIGYVAVANDQAATLLGRRDIVIAWRGTAFVSELIKDVYALQQTAPLILGNSSTAKVHSGFYSLYSDSKEGSTYSSQSARDQVLIVLKDLLEQYKDEDVSITVVGHSLGGALATLNATDIVANGYNTPDGDSGKSIMVTAFVFGSPRVGDDNFKTAFDDLKAKGLHLLRISNVLDRVPTLPPENLSITLPIIGEMTLQYTHVGIELKVDTKLSKYLKEGIGVHNIDVYLHSCAGSHGVDKEFELEVPLDLALLNRREDALATKLKYSLNIPNNWWYPAENKDMIQYENGDFKLKPDLFVPTLDLDVPVDYCM